ncbi:hypothetical protein BDC45DRAFT_606095 [Circinella umbellata]|nr:hypothetical protein BDC45DRAFT_606095 [Circinella umbellata]
MRLIPSFFLFFLSFYYFMGPNFSKQKTKNKKMPTINIQPQVVAVPYIYSISTPCITIQTYYPQQVFVPVTPSAPVVPPKAPPPDLRTFWNPRNPPKS